ncbi:TAXI family TRAP transporter solute-binding subunit [Hyphomonas johnsonii]|uniref:TRAP transporter solute receptor TAXI family protein n=1 Tax=Hyphomonas johnsonii MHS-2 TaxID=1280950 RepID=A0A059FH91_9PROT|nr:TAXI family TRAP transporter solute-binding subunit [Hyphomonas johnsonii]KCZ90005.1 TRAP transporter solute receptor TAXI family protein [Hyphomonas johnsonii MHS-2]
MVTAIKDFLKIYWPLVLLAIAGVVTTLFLMDPAPPHRIQFAAGSPGGAYYAYAERYQRLLGEQGVKVELIQTAGSVENLRLLDEGQADVALVQGGLAQPGDAANLQSLGGLYHEPFWVFVRSELGATDFGALRTARLAIGPDGSGTRMLALDLQGEFGGTWPPESRITLTGSAAVDALLAGEVDAAAFAAAPDASYVQSLLRTPGIMLLPFERASALARRQPALADVILLRGVVDIGADLPPHDVPLVAPVAQLVVTRSLHPAIEALLIDSAAAIHRDGSLLAPAGTFPDPNATDLPISRQAKRYYVNGPSFLRRYFSFSMANFLDRAWILAIPLLTLMFPLVRVAPPIYRWRVRRKIYVWYKDLRDLEARGRALPGKEERAAITDELEDLQVEIGELDVPLSYTDDLYRLRNHVEFVKHLLTSTRPPPGLGV